MSNPKFEWANQEASVWGPNPMDIKGYLKKCNVIVNGRDKTEWFLAQVDKLKIMYV